jgi:hypothetical protein
VERGNVAAELCCSRAAAGRLRHSESACSTVAESSHGALTSNTRVFHAGDESMVESPSVSRARITNVVLLGAALVLTIIALRRSKPDSERPVPPSKKVDAEREIRMLGGHVDRTEPGWLKVTFAGANDSNLHHLRTLDGIKSLHLRGSRVTDSSLVHLSTMADLEVLDLTQTQVSNAGLKHVQSLARLRELKLGRTRITGEGLEQLSPLTELEILFLEMTQIDDDSLAHLAALTKLSLLDLSGPPVASVSLREPKLGRAQMTGVDSEQLIPLSELEVFFPEMTQDLKRLKALDLGSTTEVSRVSGILTDKGLQHLRGLTNLRALNLMDNEVTEEGIAELQAALPNTLIYF